MTSSTLTEFLHVSAYILILQDYFTVFFYKGNT